MTTPPRAAHVALRLAAVVAGSAVALLAAGCGGGRAVTDRVPGSRLAIYVSVPLQGASGVNGVAVVRGARMALAAQGSRIGRYRIVMRTLDDSLPHPGGWDPGQTEVAARRAAQDPAAVGYVGDLDSGASAISIPILNRAGIAQVSPASSAVGLTASGPGADPGEPGKYYPTGQRTFARIVPSDAVEASLQVRLQRSLGCRATYVLADGQVDGQDAAMSFSAAAQAAGLRVIAVESYARDATDYTPLVRAVAASGADCVLISAATESNAVLLTRQLAAGLPAARIFGTAGLAESTYTDPSAGGLPPALDHRVLITAPSLTAAALPRPGRSFLAAYRTRYGAAEPGAILGYEAMGLLLDAIRRATGDGRTPPRRSQVVRALLSTRDRAGALGRYSIGRDGDTTLRRYGVYRVVGGRLVLWQAPAL